MHLIDPTPHNGSWFMDREWCRLTSGNEPWEGPNGILLSASRIKGIPALITAPWALHAEWQGEAIDAIKQALEKQYRPLVVLDLPLYADCSWASPWIVQESHTRMLNWSNEASGLKRWPKHRLKQVKKAMARGIMIESSHDVNEMVQLHQMARHRKSIASDEEGLKKLLEYVFKSPHQSSLVARDATGKAIANAIILHNQGRSVYAFGGQIRSSDSALATVYLLHRAMEIAAKIGQTSFDFGGSRDSGVDRFYAEFGAQKVLKQRAILCRKPQSWWLRFLRPDLMA
jgi:hypothetical protein